MKSQSQLQESLARIIAAAPASVGLADQVKACLTRTIALVDNGANDQNLSLNLLGGQPVLPAGFRTPVDKRGQKLQFAAQLDLRTLGRHDLLGPDGFIYLFCAAERQAHAKDRQGAAIIYLAENTREALTAALGETATGRKLSPLPTYTINPLAIDSLVTSVGPETVKALREWAADFNECAVPQGHQVGGACQNLETLKIISSFCASGITYSAERAEDWHYKHLVEHAARYQLRLRLQAQGGTINVLTYHDEEQTEQPQLDQRFWDKAWLLRETHN